MVVTTLEGSKKVFTAKSIKNVTPIEFDVALALNLVCQRSLNLATGHLDPMRDLFDQVQS